MPARARPARLLSAALAALLALGLAACADDDGGAEEGSPAQGRATQAAGATLAQVPEVYRALQPSVVAVLVRRGQGAGEGSGVAWSERLVVTNNHVVEGAGDVEVALASGERVPARVRATDPRTDLAVLELQGRTLPPARFRDELPQVGELAIALGNPLGFENTATAGIVSGLDRAIPSGGRTPALVGLVQTDAAISPGNSGGALVDGEGSVIGINVAYIPPQARAVSIGFAIPAPTVRDVVEQLLEDGQVEHPYLGVQLRPLVPTIVERLDLPVDAGALVFAVEPGGPAAEAGLRPGDVIVRLGDREVRSVEDVLAALREREPGQRVEVEVVRGDARRTLELMLATRPGPA